MDELKPFTDKIQRLEAEIKALKAREGVYHCNKAHMDFGYGCTFCEIESLQAKVQRSEKALRAFEPIVLDHTQDCSFDTLGVTPESDFCDCGLASRRRMLQLALSDK